MRPYPEYLARGVKGEEYLTGDPDVPFSDMLFQFAYSESKDRHEMSVVWLDNSDAEEYAKNILIKEKGEPLFKLGFAVIRKKDLDKVNNNSYYNGVVKYSRDPTFRGPYKNPYHGNLWYSRDDGILGNQFAAEIKMKVSKWYTLSDSMPVGNLPKLTKENWKAES